MHKYVLKNIDWISFFVYVFYLFLVGLVTGVLDFFTQSAYQRSLYFLAGATVMHLTISFHSRIFTSRSCA